MASKAKKEPADKDVKKFIAEADRLRQAEKYDKSLATIGRIAEWHEGKQKGDFGLGEKRSESFIRDEMDCCRTELKERRRARLRVLYETEARQHELELAQKGLSVQRDYH